ncbi:MAG: hypothetical protein RLZZ519_2356 [Bacteroidota bacterium]|jgi:hypothetical protein
MILLLNAVDINEFNLNLRRIQKEIKWDPMRFRRINIHFVLPLSASPKRRYGQIRPIQITSQHYQLNPPSHLHPTLKQRKFLRFVAGINQHATIQKAVHQVHHKLRISGIHVGGRFVEQQ